MFPQEIDQSPKTRYYRRIHTSSDAEFSTPYSCWY